nr:MAG TPA: hypothetical protein [Caudoviricetes sp.]
MQVGDGGSLNPLTCRLCPRKRQTGHSYHSSASSSASSCSLWELHYGLSVLSFIPHG